ncbi:MAG TPA: hypothetical protein VJR58_12860 [Vineibacter sp.]|nr:hypothetical protein [Vineibacter sp.]
MIGSARPWKVFALASSVASHGKQTKEERPLMLREWFAEYAQDRFLRKGYDIIRYSSRIASLTFFITALGIVSYVTFIAD